LSTALILVSSVTLETARRSWRNLAGDRSRPWLLLTGALGIGFLGSQLLAWRQLVGQGVYVASNPHSSFFYLLTAAHGIHLLGGLAALAYLLLRRTTPRGAEKDWAQARAKGDAVTLYWHFLDLLWVYLFVLLFYVR
jgi:cytochrome c oxidase subunit 3